VKRVSERLSGALYSLLRVLGGYPGGIYSSLGSWKATLVVYTSPLESWKATLVVYTLSLGVLGGYPGGIYSFLGSWEATLVVYIPFLGSWEATLGGIYLPVYPGGTSCLVYMPPCILLVGGTASLLPGYMPPYCTVLHGVHASLCVMREASAQRGSREPKREGSEG